MSAYVCVCVCPEQMKARALVLWLSWLKCYCSEQGDVGMNPRGAFLFIYDPARLGHQKTLLTTLNFVVDKENPAVFWPSPGHK